MNEHKDVNIHRSEVPRNFSLPSRINFQEIARTDSSRVLRITRKLSIPATRLTDLEFNKIVGCHD